MSRIVLRNLLMALGVALPVLLASGAVVGWLLPPAWAGDGGSMQPSLTGFLGGFVFWYLILALPALGIAGLHQVVLAALPHDWSPRTTRPVILGTSLGIGALVVGYVAATATAAHVLGLVLTVVPPAVAYGLLARPVRPAEASYAARRRVSSTRP